MRSSPRAGDPSGLSNSRSDRVDYKSEGAKARSFGWRKCWLDLVRGLGSVVIK